MLPFGGFNSGELPFDPEKLNKENPFEDEEVRGFFVNKLGIPEEILDSGGISIVNLDNFSPEDKSKIPNLLSGSKFIKKIIDGEIDQDSIMDAMVNPNDPLNKELMSTLAETHFAMENYKAFKHSTKNKISKVLCFLNDMGEHCYVIDCPMMMRSWLYFEDGINNINLFKKIGRNFVDWKNITTKSKKLSVVLYPSEPSVVMNLFRNILSSN